MKTDKEIGPIEFVFKVRAILDEFLDYGGQREMERKLNELLCRLKGHDLGPDRRNKH